MRKMYAILVAFVCALSVIMSACSADVAAAANYQAAAPVGNANADAAAATPAASTKSAAAATAASTTSATPTTSTATATPTTSTAAAAATSAAGTTTARSSRVKGKKLTAAELKNVSIVMRDSSLAMIGGKLTDLVEDMPVLSPYLRSHKTYVPLEFAVKSFGVEYSHDDDKGELTLTKSGNPLFTLSSTQYDYAADAYGGEDYTLYVPLRQLAEKLGKSVSYYDGLVTVSDKALPANLDKSQIASWRKSLTGATAVQTEEKFEKLISGVNAVYRGAYENHIEQTREMRTGGPGGGIAMPAFGGSFAAGIPMPESVESEPDTASSVPSLPSVPMPTGAPAADMDTGYSADTAVEESESALTDASNTAAGEVGGAAGDDYSTTNTQVEGVDESDVVKTDGRYIYQVNGERVLIVDAYPVSGMKIVGQITFEKENGENLRPMEMYADGDRLVVIGLSERTYELEPPKISSETTTGGDGVVRDEVKAESQARTADSIASADISVADGAAFAADPKYFGEWTQTTRALVYDITDRSNPKLVRDSEVEGYYSSSRKIGDALYLVVNKHLNYYHAYHPLVRDPRAEPAVTNAPGKAPASTDGPSFDTVSYRDSAAATAGFRGLNYPNIYYFPGCVAQNYLVVAGINIRDTKKAISISSVLDNGSNIYASGEYLYVAAYNYRNHYWDTSGGSDSYESEKTSIHRFKLNNGEVVYDGMGEVKGTILNQFSMDQYGEFLRVATTSSGFSESLGYSQDNNLYVLDSGLSIVGRLEGLAPGEQIYSARFIGDRAYVVTFKTTDPLFVIDLSDPTNPNVLGALKIPGYSDYLHPYDENHIIGFGKDTVEYQNEWAKDGSTSAYYQGMKVALFDVTDVANPKELFKTNIGDRGTDSELLYNHKALLFSKERGLLAFPVTVMTVPDSQKTGNIVKDSLQYGQFEFQGAYVYNLSLTDGFTLKGRISHISEEEYRKSGSNYWGKDGNMVERLLYIKESLYALSQRYITAHDINNPTTETGRIDSSTFL